jgi:hypothetical protein
MQAKEDFTEMKARETKLDGLLKKISGDDS